MAGLTIAAFIAWKLTVSNAELLSIFIQPWFSKAYNSLSFSTFIPIIY